MISEALNDILWEDMHTTVLLETMAGKGTDVGRSFEENDENHSVFCYNKSRVLLRMKYSGKRSRLHG